MPPPTLLCFAFTLLIFLRAEPIAISLNRERLQANKIDNAEDYVDRKYGCNNDRSKRRLRTYRGAMLQELYILGRKGVASAIHSVAPATGAQNSRSSRFC